LLYDGQPIATALVPSHDEQAERLVITVSEALPATVVVGDPCHDRILVSRRLRERYRRALGVDRDRTVVVVSSTWCP
jgi:hypothetical protein